MKYLVLVLAVLSLTGCAVYPYPGPYYDPYVYPAPVVRQAPVYVQPAPIYVQPALPVYPHTHRHYHRH